MKKRFSRNNSRFSIEKMKIFYTIILMNDETINHISARFRNDSTRFFQQVQKIFDDLYRIYENSNRKLIVKKTFRELCHIKQFQTF